MLNLATKSHPLLSPIVRRLLRARPLAAQPAPAMTNPETAASIYDFHVKTIKGELISLEAYRGHVCIIVNVASQCGFTKNHYADLNDVYAEFSAPKGLRILGFPCNQFGAQEPADNAEICHFASGANVKFDLFAKVDVNGKHADPLWVYLKNKQPGGVMGKAIKWNFTKFIIDKNGQPVERFGANTGPKQMIKSLEKYW